MPQLDYPTSQSVGLVGDIASMRPHRKVGRAYPKQKQVTVIAIGGNDNGTYSFRVTDKDGQSHVVSFVASGDSADDIGAALEQDANDGTTAPNLRNVLTASWSDGDDELTLTALRAGEAFTVEFVSNPNTNMTQTTSTAATKADLSLGIALRDVDGEKADVLASTSEAISVLGVLSRGQGLEAPDDGSETKYSAGQNIDVLAEGDIFVMPEEDVSVGDPVFVRRAQTSNAGTVGAFRKSAAGGAQVSTIVPVVDQANYGFTLGVAGRTFTALYNPTDGTTAVADAIDGLYDAIVEQLGGDDSATNGLGVTITESDTALTITTDAGVVLDSLENCVWNADAEAASTVATVGTPDADAIELPSTRFRWAKAGGPTSGEPAVLSLL